MLLGQPALVLRLQVDAPSHGELEALAALLQGGDGVAVAHPLEAGRHEPLQARDAVLVDALGEELQVVGAFLQQGLEHELQKALRQIGVGGQIGEGDLGLDHPELGQVPAGVAVLGAEGGTKRVDLGQCQAVGLHIQLTAHGEKGLSGEEILSEVDLARAVAGKVGEVEGTDPEHLAGPLTVAGRDDGRVDPEESLLVKEPVNGNAQAVPHAGHGSEGVGPRAEVGHLAQVLEGVTLLLDGVGLRVVHPAHHLDARGGELDRLALSLAGHDGADHRDGAASAQPGDLGVVVRQVTRGDHLDGIEARAVMQVNEREARLRVAARSNPPPHGHRVPDPRAACQDLRHAHDGGANGICRRLHVCSVAHH